MRRRILMGQGSDSRLPSAYQEVEYLESDGQQYINAGIVANTKTVEVRGKMQPMSGTDIYAKYFGVYDGSKYAIHCQRDTNVGTAWGMLYAFGNKSVKIATPSVPAEFSLKDGNLNVNGTDYSIALTDESTINNRPIFLFALNRNGSVTQSSCVRIYSFAVLTSSVAVLDLIPCYRKSNSKPGMYDLVSGTFFTNSGTGVDFIVGPNVN